MSVVAGTEPSAADLDELVAGQTVPSRFAATVAHRPLAPALDGLDADGHPAHWTFAEYAERACSVAAGLAALGVEPGGRVVLMLRNGLVFHAVDMAVLLCGATPVSIYNSSSTDQVAYLAAHARATVAVVEDRFVDRFLEARDRLPHLEHVVVVGNGASAGAGTRSWADLLRDPVDLAEAAGRARPDDLATVIYTSGTTGPPKGVMISHTNVCFTAESLRARYRRPEAGLRLVSYLPMAHIAERMTSHYLHALFGYEVACCPEVSGLAEAVRATRPQLVFGVPRVWEKIVAGVRAAVAADPHRAAMLEEAVTAAGPLAEARDAGGTLSEDQQQHWALLDMLVFSGLRKRVGLDAVALALSGAAPIPADTLRWFRSVGVPLSEIYGLSESTGPIAWEPYAVRPGRVGRPVPGCEVKLLDDGEIAFRGGNAFVGYLDDPATTAATLIDGWVHTGDIGEIDDDGYLGIVDRKKELIITAGGKNVSPANIEGALRASPLIGQAAIVGDNRPYIAALIVLDPEVAPAWAARRGIPGSSLADLAADPDVLAEVARCVDVANAGFNHAEQVKRHRVLADEWLPDSAELTPTMKLKRRGITARYAAEIAGLYGG